MIIHQDKNRDDHNQNYVDNGDAGSRWLFQECTLPYFLIDSWFTSIKAIARK